MSTDEGPVPFEEDPTTAPEEAPEEASEEAPEDASEEAPVEAAPAELSALQRLIGKFRKS